jgi:hypothetical protein
MPIAFTDLFATVQSSIDGLIPGTFDISYSDWAIGPNHFFYPGWLVAPSANAIFTATFSGDFSAGLGDLTYGVEILGDLREDVIAAYVQTNTAGMVTLRTYYDADTYPGVTKYRCRVWATKAGVTVYSPYVTGEMAANTVYPVVPTLSKVGGGTHLWGATSGTLRTTGVFTSDIAEIRLLVIDAYTGVEVSSDSFRDVPGTTWTHDIAFTAGTGRLVRTEIFTRNNIAVYTVAGGNVDVACSITQLAVMDDAGAVGGAVQLEAYLPQPPLLPLYPESRRSSAVTLTDGSGALIPVIYDATPVSNGRTLVMHEKAVPFQLGGFKLYAVIPPGTVLSTVTATVVARLTLARAPVQGPVLLGYPVPDYVVYQHITATITLSQPIVVPRAVFCIPSQTQLYRYRGFVVVSTGLTSSQLTTLLSRLARTATPLVTVEVNDTVYTPAYHVELSSGKNAIIKFQTMDEAAYTSLAPHKVRVNTGVLAQSTPDMEVNVPMLHTLAPTVYYGPDGSDAADGATPATAYATLQKAGPEAVNAVVPKRLVSLVPNKHRKPDWDVVGPIAAGNVLVLVWTSHPAAARLAQQYVALRGIPVNNYVEIPPWVGLTPMPNDDRTNITYPQMRLLLQFVADITRQLPIKTVVYFGHDLTPAHNASVAPFFSTMTRMFAELEFHNAVFNQIHPSTFLLTAANPDAYVNPAMYVHYKCAETDTYYPFVVDNDGLYPRLYAHAPDQVKFQPVMPVFTVPVDADDAEVIFPRMWADGLFAESQRYLTEPGPVYNSGGSVTGPNMYGLRHVPYGVAPDAPETAVGHDPATTHSVTPRSSAALTYARDCAGQATRYPAAGIHALTAPGQSAFIPSDGVYAASVAEYTYFGENRRPWRTSDYGFMRGALTMFHQSNPGSHTGLCSRSWESPLLTGELVLTTPVTAAFGAAPPGTYYGGTQYHQIRARSRTKNVYAYAMGVFDTASLLATIEITATDIVYRTDGVNIAYILPWVGKTLHELYDAFLSAPISVRLYTNTTANNRVVQAIRAGAAFSVGSQLEPYRFNSGKAMFLAELIAQGFNLAEAMAYQMSNGMMEGGGSPAIYTAEDRATQGLVPAPRSSPPIENYHANTWLVIGDPLYAPLAGRRPPHITRKPTKAHHSVFGTAVAGEEVTVVGSDRAIAITVVADAAGNWQIPRNMFTARAQTLTPQNAYATGRAVSISGYKVLKSQKTRIRY